MVSFILCLLPALLATTSAQVATLTCDTCFGLTENCEFAPGTCQDNNATGGCLSVAEDITLDGTRTSFYKQCLNTYKSDIKVPMSFNVGNGKYFRINITQCNDTDNCNSAVLGVPKENATKNGLQCPTCFALNFTVCNVQTTPCTGDETYCMDFTGYLVKDSGISGFVGKGCATESTKDIKPETTLISTVYRYVFLWGSSVPADAIPTTPPPTSTTPRKTTNPPPTNATSANTPSPPPTSTNPAKPTTLPKTTSSGASLAVGKFSFALYLPGLTGLLLVKLLS
ncbi:phospholipase A2 inhibitor and Ly6/PLAUR domain-containing protein-like [Gopherus evgoodei]|uniref:phospholipase A2 inhibitor and Ly6/PLAUR domain-containing protein-like n=1 Tax=Gopherus evgoodei TaxID=1825980 RepID=UPI0011D007D4|nr:phospholipase A2 inhibitor and Ly6/PLAUR domain-containing protein-like [Gopherus evgoodei]